MTVRLPIVEAEPVDTENPDAGVARDLALFGISKSRLYEIALILDTDGYKNYATDVRAAADYLDEVMVSRLGHRFCGNARRVGTEDP
jgi:hypothetical protein